MQKNAAHRKKQIVKQVICFLSLVFTLTACQEKQEIIEDIRPIKTMVVNKQSAGQILKFSGLAASVDSSDLSFQVAGQVISVTVDIGDRVKKGQVIAALDPEPYKLDVEAITAELKKAQNNVKESKIQYDRQLRIYEQGAGVKSHLDIAEYNLKDAHSAVDYQKAKLDLANRNLSKTRLLSPYSGTIAWRSIEPNEEVKTGQKVFEINASGNMEVQLTVPETAIDKIHINEEVTVTFSTLPGKSIKGMISFVGSAAVQANAFPVKVALVDPDKRVKPGMSAEINFTVTSENIKSGYVIPLQAILPAKEPNQGYVFVFDQQTSMIKKTPIHFNNLEQQNVNVTDGLSSGDIIAVAGVSFLADGMTVRLMQ